MTDNISYLPPNTIWKGIMPQRCPRCSMTLYTVSVSVNVCASCVGSQRKTTPFFSLCIAVGRLRKPCSYKFPSVKNTFSFRNCKWYRIALKNAWVPGAPGRTRSKPVISRLLACPCISSERCRFLNNAVGVGHSFRYCRIPQRWVDKDDSVK